MLLHLNAVTIKSATAKKGLLRSSERPGATWLKISQERMRSTLSAMSTDKDHCYKIVELKWSRSKTVFSGRRVVWGNPEEFTCLPVSPCDGHSPCHASFAAAPSLTQRLDYAKSCRMKDEYHCNQFYHTNHTLQEASLNLCLYPNRMSGSGAKNSVCLGLAQIHIHWLHSQTPALMTQSMAMNCIGAYRKTADYARKISASQIKLLETNCYCKSLHAIRYRALRDRVSSLFTPTLDSPNHQNSLEGRLEEIELFQVEVW